MKIITVILSCFLLCVFLVGCAGQAVGTSTITTPPTFVPAKNQSGKPIIYQVREFRNILRKDLEPSIKFRFYDDTYVVIDRDWLQRQIKYQQAFTRELNLNSPEPKFDAQFKSGLYRTLTSLSNAASGIRAQPSVGTLYWTTPESKISDIDHPEATPTIMALTGNGLVIIDPKTTDIVSLEEFRQGHRLINVRF